MLKNKKGFTLSEMLMVVLILSLLAGIGIPQYRNAARKTKISVHLPIMRTLQDSIVNYYNLNNKLPTKLWQLTIDKREYTVSTDKVGIHKASNCTVSLNNDTSKINISTDCSSGWTLVYEIVPSSVGYSAGDRLFKVTGDTTVNEAIAKSFGWKETSPSHTFKIQ